MYFYYLTNLFERYYQINLLSMLIVFPLPVYVHSSSFKKILRILRLQIRLLKQVSPRDIVPKECINLPRKAHIANTHKYHKSLFQLCKQDGVKQIKHVCNSNKTLNITLLLRLRELISTFNIVLKLVLFNMAALSTPQLWSR